MPPQSTNTITNVVRDEKIHPSMSTIELNTTDKSLKLKPNIILINGKQYDITNFNHPGKLICIDLINSRSTEGYMLWFGYLDLISGFLPLSLS